MLKTIKLNWKPGDYFEDLRHIVACLDNPTQKVRSSFFFSWTPFCSKKKKKNEYKSSTYY